MLLRVPNSQALMRCLTLSESRDRTHGRSSSLLLAKRMADARLLAGRGPERGKGLFVYPSALVDEGRSPGVFGTSDRSEGCPEEGSLVEDSPTEVGATEVGSLQIGVTFMSRTPPLIVFRDNPVASDTALMPPRPKESASTAAHRRRERSLSSGSRASNFARIHSTISRSFMPLSWRRSGKRSS